MSSASLMLLGHRVYDPEAGRFLSPDPIRDRSNWYAYVDGNPLSFVDPEGLARIYLAYRSVAGAGNHVYLIIEDEITGKLWTIGGGPAGGGVSPGILKDHSGPAGPRNYESLMPGPVPVGAILILDDNQFGMFWFNKANNIGGEIEAKRLAYNPLGTNSNAFLYTVLKRAGLLDNWIATRRNNELSHNAWTGFGGGSEWAPGWRTVLPR